MRPPFTKGRLITFAIAAVLFGCGLYFLRDGHRRHEEFLRWETAKPVEGVVDFSRPGRFVLPFQQTCSSSHGEVVALRVPPEALKDTPIKDLLSGLEADLEITGEHDGQQAGTEVAEILWNEETLDGAIPVFSLAPFLKGDFTATITVNEGAPALAGIPQTVEGRYLLCGLEGLPAFVATALGWGSTAFGGLVGLVTLLWPRGKPNPTQASH